MRILALLAPVLQVLPMLHLGAVFAEQPLIADFPTDFRASYTLKSSTQTLANVTWRVMPIADGRLVYESEVQPIRWLGFNMSMRVIERSVWRLDNTSLKALNYEYRRFKRSGVDREVKVAFDWDKGEAYNTSEGHTWRMPVPAGTLDKLNYLLALMADLAKGKRELVYSIADGGHLKEYRVRRLGREALSTPKGEVAVVKLVRHHPRAPDLVIWSAPELRYLPVRMDYEHNRRLFSLTLVDWEGLKLETEVQDEPNLLTPIRRSLGETRRD